MDQELLNRIIATDTTFNEAMFKSYVDNMFIKIYSAIMYDELDTVKHFMKDELYNYFKQQLEILNKKNLRQMYDELNVKSTEIINFEITEDLMIINVKLIARYMDYYLKKDTGDFVSGNNQSRITKEFILKLTKKRDFLIQKNVRKCKGCGASISTNTTGICAYCGTHYNQEDYNYILESLTMQ